MFLSSTQRRIFPVGRGLFAFFLSTMLMGAASDVPPRTGGGAQQLLAEADGVRTSNYAEFSSILQQLDRGSTTLSPEQGLYLRYLKAWQIAYRGDYATAIPQLDSVVAESSNVTLRFRAGITAVNLLGIASRYEDAFARLDHLLDELPGISDKRARQQGLGIAAQLYIEAGQYDLASGYAARLIAEDPAIDNLCKGGYLRLEALYRSGNLKAIDSKFQDGVDACARASEPIFANGIRANMSDFYINHGRPEAAIKLLESYYSDVRKTRYARLVSHFDALIALAYWRMENAPKANEYALHALQSSIRNEYTEPLTMAYQVLYQMAKKQGSLADALSYHEKYMAADKGYLNELSAKALAFQTVKQQVLAKKLQIDTLNKQNQILVLQQKLGKKAAETSRLYILLLLGVLVSIGLWSYRLKRSQLRFMKLARRDGLTGIFNRQHFVSEAELQLQYCKKSSRDVSMVLIDLDHFKVVNDTHGHGVGDRVLQRAVGVCKAQLRSTDIFGRLGGEEFGILLPECTLEQAAVRAEQIRAAITEASAADEFPRVAVSASFGVASSVYSGYELRQLLIHADEALYQAKRDGRNRVHVNDNHDACLKMG